MNMHKTSYEEGDINDKIDTPRDHNSNSCNDHHIVTVFIAR